MVADYVAKKKAEAHRRAKHAYYARCRASGLCTACGKPAVPGKSNCEEHLRLANERSKQRREQHRRAGGCEHCGTKVKETERLCPTCRNLSRERQHQWRQANEDRGMCYICGQRRPMNGRRKCRVCRQSILLSQRRAAIRRRRTGELRRLLINPDALERLAGLLSDWRRNRRRPNETAAD